MSIEFTNEAGDGDYRASCGWFAAFTWNMLEFRATIYNDTLYILPTVVLNREDSQISIFFEFLIVSLAVSWGRLEELAEGFDERY